MLAKKPSPPTKETKAQKFIRAGSPGPAPAAANGPDRGQLKPIFVNIPLPLLERINGTAASMGLTRSAFVLMAINERLLKAERGE